jgi:hypothetical protein
MSNITSEASPNVRSSKYTIVLNRFAVAVSLSLPPTDAAVRFPYSGPP